MENTGFSHLKALTKLGQLLSEDNAERAGVIRQAAIHNPWFTQDHIYTALDGIRANLRSDQLKRWLQPYEPARPQAQLKIGLVLAGNIPLVGFHDILCVLVSEHRAMIKLSDKDRHLGNWLLKKMGEAAPEYARQLSVCEQLEKPDAVIATGSNNSARYFETYFGKYPHIIRKNRNAAAILKGNETEEELRELGKDIFLYFGLGCRNVSKLYVPRDYDFQQLFNALEPYQDILQHHKYANNYGYQLTIRQMNRAPHFNNGFLLLIEEAAYASPIACLHYEYYQDDEALQRRLKADAGKLQCVLSAKADFPETIPFGQAQFPALWDYADNIDTLKFLFGLNSSGRAAQG